MLEMSYKSDKWWAHAMINPNLLRDRHPSEVSASPLLSLYMLSWLSLPQYVCFSSLWMVLSSVFAWPVRFHLYGGEEPVWLR